MVTVYSKHSGATFEMSEELAKSLGGGLAPSLEEHWSLMPVEVAPVVLPPKGPSPEDIRKLETFREAERLRAMLPPPIDPYPGMGWRSLVG